MSAVLFHVYILDRGERMYLMDWIVEDGIDHPCFTTIRDRAMCFTRFDGANAYRKRLLRMHYQAHVV